MAKMLPRHGLSAGSLTRLGGMPGVTTDTHPYRPRGPSARRPDRRALVARNPLRWLGPVAVFGNRKSLRAPDTPEETSAGTLENLSYERRQKRVRNSFAAPGRISSWRQCGDPLAHGPTPRFPCTDANLAGSSGLAGADRAPLDRSASRSSGAAAVEGWSQVTNGTRGGV